MVGVTDSQKWKGKTAVLVMLFCFTNGGWSIHSSSESDEVRNVA